MPTTSLGDKPRPLTQILKHLAREWRIKGRGDGNAVTSDAMNSYLALPFFTLLSSIKRHTQQSFSRSELEHIAWYSDRPLERTPPLPRGTFISPDPALDEFGFPEDFAVGSDLEQLRIIHNELMQCDQDGRTATIVADLEAAHPGILGLRDETPASAPATPPAKTATKRSTERGEAQVKLIAALSKHHKYADGSCLNQEPIGNNELARLAGVAKRTASAFFKDHFQGHTRYRKVCQDAGTLAYALKELNNEFTLSDRIKLYGRRPPDEDDRYDGDSE